jgi:hypothetical protein
MKSRAAPQYIFKMSHKPGLRRREPSLLASTWTRPQNSIVVYPSTRSIGLWTGGTYLWMMWWWADLTGRLISDHLRGSDSSNQSAWRIIPRMQTQVYRFQRRDRFVLSVRELFSFSLSLFSVAWIWRRGTCRIRVTTLLAWLDFFLSHRCRPPLIRRPS